MLKRFKCVQIFLKIVSAGLYSPKNVKSCQILNFVEIYVNWHFWQLYSTSNVYFKVKGVCRYVDFLNIVFDTSRSSNKTPELHG